MSEQAKLPPLDEVANRLDELYKALGVNRPFSSRLLREEITELRRLVGEAQGGKAAITAAPPPSFPIAREARPEPKPKGEKL